MKSKRFTEEQITYALREAESGTPVADFCRQLGVSEPSFYLGKKKLANTARRRSARCVSCPMRTHA
jgi:putative transposase